MPNTLARYRERNLLRGAMRQPTVTFLFYPAPGSTLSLLSS
jgi:hypothetical protein